MREDENTVISVKECIPLRLDSSVPLYPDNWPKTIRCEMNVEAWEQALDNAGLLPEYKDVLTGFIVGFDQGIPAHKIRDQPFFTPKNHSSSLMVSEKINENIRKEVQAKRMFGPFSHAEVSRVYSFYRSNPLGAVVNNDGGIRPINDLSFPRNTPDTPSVNSFVDKKKFITT